MVGVVMGDEDVPKISKRHICEYQLPANSFSAIDDIGDVVDENDPRGLPSHLIRSRASTRS
jgi:hypothetical protein